MALTDKLTAIGNAIREKTGKSALLSLDEMPVEIGAIQGGEIIQDSSLFELRYFGDSYNSDTYYNDELTKIRNYAFAGSKQYNVFNLPNVEYMGEGVMYFAGCNGDNMTLIAPKLISLGKNCFDSCYKNITFDAPNIKILPLYCFAGCGVKNTEFEFYNEGIEEAYDYCFNQCKFPKITLPNLTTAGINCFQNCESIELNLPNLTTVDNNCFYFCSCPKITLPNLTTTGNGCFSYYKGTELNLPNLLEIKSQFCSNSSTVKKIDFGEKCKTIIAPPYNFHAPFYSCSALETLIFRSTTLIPNPSKDTFYSSSISKGTGYIYVPAALVEEYKIAANWSVYAAQFRAIEDYPEICGGA